MQVCFAPRILQMCFCNQSFGCLLSKSQKDVQNEQINFVVICSGKSGRCGFTYVNNFAAFTQLRKISQTVTSIVNTYDERHE